MNGKHKSEESARRNHLIGTLPYISYFVHCGSDVSRRDDIMSVLYIFLFLLYGELYWEHIPPVSYASAPVSDIQDKTHIEYPRNSAIREFKQCDAVLLYLEHHSPLYPQWNPVLPCLREIVEYVYQLSFVEMPDYDYLYNHTEHYDTE